jgi:hypothetical protein
MGAACFTRRGRRVPVPKGFKLPHDQQKYDGSEEPQSWLSDYLQAVKILGGSKEIAMQSLQLHLTSTARSWLGKLKRDNRELGQNCQIVHRQFQVNLQKASVNRRTQSLHPKIRRDTPFIHTMLEHNQKFSQRHL